MPRWNRFRNLQNLARAMWKHAREIPPRSFRTLFDRVYGSTSDIPTLWQLGGATNDFLRVHPDALTVPIELAKTLVRADHKEARVIGLKLLNRCRAPDELVVGEAIRALQRKDGYESYGGLCELQRLLERHQRDGSSIDRNLVGRLNHELTALVDDEDENHRHMARVLAEWLGDMDRPSTDGQ